MTAGLAVPEGVSDLGFLAAPFVAEDLDLGAMAKVRGRKRAVGWEVVVDARKEVCLA